MSYPITVTDQNFEEEVINSEVPVLIDFWATWCAPCRMIAPIVEELAKEYDGKVKITKMDVDSNQQTAAKYGIMSIPTLLVMKKGEIVDKVIGAVPKSQITAKLDAVA